MLISPHLIKRELFHDLQPSSEPVNIPSSVGTATGTRHCREADKHRRLLVGSAQEGRGGEVTPVAIAGEGAVSTSATGVDSPFGYLTRATPSINVSRLMHVLDVSDVTWAPTSTGMCACI